MAQRTETRSMTRALFMNGVFRNTLEDILKAQESDPDVVGYLQPYKSSPLVFLRDSRPTLQSRILLLVSTSDMLAIVQYRAQVIQWEDKQRMSQERRHEVDQSIRTHQPSETNGLYISEEGGHDYVNLISMIMPLHPKMFPTSSNEQMSVTFDPRVRWTGDDLQ